MRKQEGYVVKVAGVVLDVCQDHVTEVRVKDRAIELRVALLEFLDVQRRELVRRVIGPVVELKAVSKQSVYTSKCLTPFVIHESDEFLYNLIVCLSGAYCDCNSTLEFIRESLLGGLDDSVGVVTGKVFFRTISPGHKRK